jgi:hypothetical protein
MVKLPSTTICFHCDKYLLHSDDAIIIKKTIYVSPDGIYHNANTGNDCGYDYYYVTCEDCREKGNIFASEWIQNIIDNQSLNANKK